MRGRMLLFLALLCLFLLAFCAGYLNQKSKLLEKERVKLEIEIELLETENAYLREKLTELKKKQSELYQKLEEWLDGWQEYDVSFYAPLDPEATEGVCFEGDRAITASGAPVKIGVTAAAGPEIPFGTWIYVQGYGWRQVQDRGGRITEGKLDIAVSTVKEALREGRKKLKVWRAIVNH